MSLPSIRDPERGIKSRSKLRTIFNSHVKGDEEYFKTASIVPEEAIADIREVLKIKDTRPTDEKEESAGQSRRKRGKGN